MKSIKLFLILAMLIASAAIAFSSFPEEETFRDESDDNMTIDENSENHWFDQDVDEQGTSLASSLLSANRFLAEKSKAVMTCNKYPRVCRVKGSPGPDCCGKKCVNVSTDRLNCGKCGRKCKYPEICCKGGCVNPMSNSKHCGGCNNKCKTKSKCAYGMCSYA